MNSNKIVKIKMYIFDYIEMANKLLAKMILVFNRAQKLRSIVSLAQLVNERHGKLYAKMVLGLDDR